MKTTNEAAALADPQRRNLLKAALNMGALTTGKVRPCCKAAAASQAAELDSTTAAAASEIAALQRRRRGNFRIDVHCHHIPDFYRLALTENGVLTAGGILDSAVVAGAGHRLYG